MSWRLPGTLPQNHFSKVSASFEWTCVVFKMPLTETTASKQHLTMGLGETLTFQNSPTGRSRVFVIHAMQVLKF